MPESVNPFRVLGRVWLCVMMGGRRADHLFHMKSQMWREQARAGQSFEELPKLELPLT